MEACNAIFYLLFICCFSGCKAYVTPKAHPAPWEPVLCYIITLPKSTFMVSHLMVMCLFIDISVCCKHGQALLFSCGLYTI